VEPYGVARPHTVVLTPGVNFLAFTPYWFRTAVEGMERVGIYLELGISARSLHLLDITDAPLIGRSILIGQEEPCLGPRHHTPVLLLGGAAGSNRYSQAQNGTLLGQLIATGLQREANSGLTAQRPAYRAKTAEIDPRIGPHAFDRRQRINCLLKLAEGGLILVDSRQSARPEAVDHECGNTHVVERPGKEPIARVDATTAMHDEHQRNGPGPCGWKAQISL